MLAVTSISTQFNISAEKSKTLKKTIFLSIAISLTGFLHSQQLFSEKQKEVQQTVVNMFQALSDRDSINLRSYCSPDITFYEYGQIWNIDTLIAKGITTNLSADFKRTNTFDFINTERDKTKAWVTYKLTSVIVRDGKETKIQWLETVFLERQKKQWKIKHLHSTVVQRS